jgi:hypothetical protein
MSITAIACQAQGIRDGEVIAKLAEDAYFMRVDNRVTQPPPPGTATTKLQVAALTSAAIVLEPSCQLSPTVLAQTPADPHRVATAIMRSSLTTARRRWPRPWRWRQRRWKLQPQSQQEGRRRRRSRGRDHANSHASGASQGGYDARQKIEELRRKKVRHHRRQQRLPRLLTSASQLAPPRQVQTFGDHQV